MYLSYRVIRKAIFGIFSLTIIVVLLWLYEMVIFERVMTYNRYTSEFNEYTYSIIRNENVYRSYLIGVEHMEIKADKISVMLGLAREIISSREGVFDILDPEYGKRYPDNITKARKFILVEEKIFRDIESTFKDGVDEGRQLQHVLYWKRWKDSSDKLWKLKSHYLRFLKLNKDSYMKELRTISQTYHILLFFLLSFSSLVFIIFLRYLLKPISQASNEIRQGNIYRIASMKTSFSELKSLFNKIVAYERDVKRKIYAIDKKADEKSELLNIMSHELRTPINVIIGSVDLLNRRSGELDNELKSYLTDLETSSVNLKILINRVLELGKAESQKTVIKECVSTLDLVDYLKVTIKGLASQTNTRIEFYYDSQFPLCFTTDEVKLKQLLLNVISNALKAVEGEGVIRIRFKVSEEHTVFHVFDSGVGIEKENICKILTPFEQVEQGYKTGSSGFGGYLIQRLAQALGGFVNIRSYKGQGTLVTMKLRILEPKGRLSDLNMAVSESITDSEEKYLRRTGLINDQLSSISISPGPLVSEFKIYDALDWIQPESQQAAAEQCAVAKRNLKILIAEDYPLNTQVLRNMLNHLGIEAVFFEDGEALVSFFIENQTFDLILMDIQMPKVDGYEASHMIREFNQKIPIIACSAHLEHEIRAKLLESQMSDFLQKPYTVEELVAVIKRNT